MRYILENEKLHVEIDSYGAELKSVRNQVTGQEYMWQGDKQFWGRTSPVLFPFVGSLKNKEYHFQGKAYSIGQHGFARDMEHELVLQTEQEIWFSLCNSEETFVKYPFFFELNIGYRLEENRLEVLWKVSNRGRETMYFSIGAHPAFNCPMGTAVGETGTAVGETGTAVGETGTNAGKTGTDADKTGYSIYFGGVDEIHHHGNDVESGLALREDLVLALEDHKTPITEHFFDRCTYMIEGAQTGEVGLVDRTGKKYVSVKFDTPLFAIWSPEGKNAPFVCIEPWFGRCDAVDFEGELEEREYTKSLEPNAIFESKYEIEYA